MENSSWTWLSYLINFLTILAVMLLAMMAGTKPTKKVNAFYLKKVCWIILITGMSYWYITVPSVSRYHEFDKKLEYPTNTQLIEEQGNYIREHQRRIDRVESELKETKDELREIKEHYNWVIKALWFGILYFGINQIIKKRDESLIESEEDKI
jgi:Na+/melibiose symporter-like transporter